MTIKKSVFSLLLLCMLSILTLLPATAESTLIQTSLSYYIDTTNTVEAETVPSDKLISVGERFNPGLYTGTLWVQLEFSSETTKNDSIYHLDIGSEPVESADIYIQSGGIWQFYGRTGFGVPRSAVQSSTMRQSITLPEKTFVDDSTHRVRLKIDSSRYGSSLFIHLRKQGFYLPRILAHTIFHSTINVLIFALMIFACIYGGLFRDYFYFALAGFAFLAILIQLQATGIGPIFLWNGFTQHKGVCAALPRVFTHLVCALIILMFRLEKGEITNGRPPFVYDTLCISISVLTVAGLAADVLPLPIPVQQIVYTATVSAIFFITGTILLSNMKKNTEKRMYKGKLFWITTAYIAGVWKILLFARTLFKAPVLMLPYDDDFIINYYLFLTILLPPVISSSARIKNRFDTLGKNADRLEALDQMHEHNKTFYGQTLQNVLDMVTVIKNAINLPELRFDTLSSKEIKNLIDFNATRSIDFLLTSSYLISSTHPQNSPLDICEFVESCVSFIKINACRKNVKVHCTIDIPHGTVLLINPHILEMLLANTSMSAVKLAPHNADMDIRFSLDDSTLLHTIKCPLQSKDMERLFDNMEELPFDLNIVQKGTRLYNGNLKVLPDGENGCTYIVSMQVEKFLAEARPSETYTASLYTPESSGGTAVPLNESFSTSTTDAPVVLLVENNINIANYFKKLLEKESNVILVPNGLEAWSFLTEMTHPAPDVIVVEQTVPFLSGEELFIKCSGTETLQNIPFVVLFPTQDDEKVQELIQKGVSSCLCKPFSSSVFKNTILSILSTARKAKRSVMSQIQNTVLGTHAQTAPQEDDTKHRPPVQSAAQTVNPRETSAGQHYGLSPREHQIALMISAGKSDKEIAQELNISSATVATHNKKIFKKLDVHSRVELMNKLR